MDVDRALAVEEGDHHEGGLALSGHLGSGGARMLPLETLTLGFRVIVVDPAFITGHQSYEYSWI